MEVDYDSYVANEHGMYVRSAGMAGTPDDDENWSEVDANGSMAYQAYECQ